MLCALSLLVERLVEIDIINLFNQILRLLSPRSSLIASKKNISQGLMSEWQHQPRGLALLANILLDLESLRQ